MTSESEEPLGSALAMPGDPQRRPLPPLPSPAAFPGGRNSQLLEAQQKPPLLWPQCPPPRPFLLGAAHPVRARTRRRGFRGQALGATWPARPDRAPRTEQESILSHQANPGPPAAPHCPGSSTVPATVRAHSPAAPLPAAGSEQYQLRCGCSADGCASSGRTRVVSPSAARRGAACGSFQGRTRCQGIG